jgi:hypothetical protein
MTVSVSVFENSSQRGPVSVSVFLKIEEKPDWTGLPSTNLVKSLQQSMDFMGVYMELLPCALEPPLVLGAFSLSANASQNHHQQWSHGRSMANLNNNMMHVWGIAWFCGVVYGITISKG